MKSLKLGLMNRWLLHQARNVSLLLCVATGILWIRSYWICDGFIWARDGNLSFGRSANGHLAVIQVVGMAKPNAAFKYVRWRDLYDGEYWRVGGASGLDVAEDWKFLGFGVQRGNQDVWTGHAHQTPHIVEYPFARVFYPYWVLVVVTAWPLYFAITFFVAGRLRAYRIGRVGLCRACGYDLRATSDRCPECGTVVCKSARA